MPIQRTNIIVDYGTALDFGKSTSWGVAPRVLVQSGTGTGVYSNNDHSNFSNFGTVEARAGMGVAMGATRASVDNYPGAVIVGLYGVVFRMPGGALYNGGTITSLSGDAGLGGAAAKLGDELGIAVDARKGGLLLDNTGLIAGDVQSATKAVDTINNAGTIMGNVRLDKGADLYDGRGGLIEGEVNGGDGADLILGGSGDDTLNGGRGRDVLRGGNGDDTLIGCYGEDVLKGGAGADTFVFANLKAPDKIKDFVVGEDSFHLDNAVMTALGVEGPLAENAFQVGLKAFGDEHRIIYDRKSGDLWYDENGDEKGGLTKLAKLAKNLDLGHEDFTII